VTSFPIYDSGRFAAFLMLLILAAFYGAYIAKMILLRRQGIQVDILGKGEKPKERAAFEIALKIVTYLGAAVQVLSVAGDMLVSHAFGRFLLPSWLGYSGHAIAAMGVACFFAALVAMGRNWRTGFSAGQETKLVTTGIYSISRNPAFLGFDVLYIGCALSFPTVWNLGFTPMAVAMFHFQILGEERFCITAFGNAYATYRARVKRYLGKNACENSPCTRE
jgi:protein-S-isoprenylcysteine O-methyltransferase Ste14